MKKKKYYVFATVWGKRNQNITKGISKKKAELYEKKLKEEMKIAIPKYKWATNIKIRYI